MKFLFLLLFSLFSIAGFTQNDPCKKHKRMLKSETDPFTNEITYTAPNSPVYIVETPDSTTLVWDIILDDLVDKRYTKLSIVYDKEIININLNEENTKYQKITGRKYSHIFSSKSIGFIGEDEVYNRCTISIRNDHCNDIMTKILNSKKNKIRVWSDTEYDFNYSSVKRDYIKYVLNLYNCLVINK